MYNQGRNNNDFLSKHFSKIVKNHVRALEITKKKLQMISSDDREQWANILALKTRSLFDQQPSLSNSDLTESLTLICALGEHFQCKYDWGSIQHVLKQMFVKENRQKLSNEEIVKCFNKANFSTAGYEVFTYDDPWYVRFVRFFSD